MNDERYTVTVYVAAPGTPLANEAPGMTSGPGHMFYVTNNGHDTPQSFGFAPLEHGSMKGPGRVVIDDNINYKDPIYARTMEVSKSQYDKLNEFGPSPEKFGFDKYYKDVRHNCVDYTWSALNHAGIERQNHADIPLSALPGMPSIRLPLPGQREGKSAYRPAQNVEDVKSIKDPVPESHLNSEQSNPMPGRRSVLQHLLSEQRLDDPAHPDFALYQQAREGVRKMDAEHGRVPTVHSDNLAASLVVAARASGLNQIEQVLVGGDASRIFAVEGESNSLHAPDQRWAHVETMEALNTPVAQSSAKWGQAVQQGDQVQAQAQAQQQEFAQHLAMQTSHQPREQVL